MKTESQHWQTLRKKIKYRLGYVWKINASYEAGVPDWYVSDKTDWWIENKRVKTERLPPVLDLTDPKKYLTMNQQLWLERRYDEGRNVGVVVFGEPGHIWLPELEWKKPITPEKYLNQAMTMDELADTLVELFTESELK